MTAQQRDSTFWTFNECIDFAHERNIEVRSSILGIKSNEISYDQAMLQKIPSVNGSISQNFNLQKGTDATGTSTGYSGKSSNNYQLSSSVSVYNGFKLNNKIKQAKF